MKDYPASYGPQDTCFNCEYSKQIEGLDHLNECKLWDLVVAVWAKCDSYQKGERFKS